MPRLALSFASLPDAPAAPLSVDGMTPTGPNLSHWPGNRTPPAWKADLSTGICLNFARAPDAEQSAFLGPTDVVLNDHYDTDGFLSLLAVLRPDIALPREEVVLGAAATGDYQAFHTERGFAIDRIVLGLRDSPASPLARDLHGRSHAERSFACYRWLIEHAELVLDRPRELAALWADDLAAVRDELRWARAGGIARRHHEPARLAVIESRQPCARITLNTLAAEFRVLHAQHGREGPLYRYHDRTESWFEVVTFTPPPRRDLAALAARLAQLEREAGGDVAGEWCADPPTNPVPELYHGIRQAQEYGRITRTLTPSRLPLALVERECAAFLGAENAAESAAADAAADAADLARSATTSGTRAASRAPGQLRGAR